VVKRRFLIIRRNNRYVKRKIKKQRHIRRIFTSERKQSS